MASKTDLIPFAGRTQGWAGGVNTRDSIATLGPDEARRLENMILDEKGAANKRLGTQSNGTFGVGADRAISLYTFYRANLAPQVLMQTTAGKLYYTNDPANLILRTPELITNGDFEVDLTGWGVTGPSSLTRDLAQHHAGVASMRVDSTGPAGGTYRPAFTPVSSALPYTMSIWVYVAVGGGTIRLYWDEYTAGSVYTVTRSTTAVLVAGWNQVQLTATTGVTTANIQPVITTPNAGFTFYLDDVHIVQGDTLTWVGWTQIATGLSATQPFSFETFNGNCYFSNGVDSYAKWDGAAYTAFGTAPKGRYIRLWKDTMFVGGVDATPDRVFESAAGDAETFPVASWVDIAKGDGDKLTALGSDGFTLIVFKQRRHMAVTDPVTLANRIVDFEKGCESHFSVVQHEGAIYFLSRRGICQYFGDSPSRIISYKIDPVFDPTIINLAALNSAQAYTIENRVGWALPEVGSNYPTFQIEYYPRLGPLSPLGSRGLGPWAFNRLPAQVFTRWRYQNNEFLYGGSMAANKFYYLLAPVGTDDGVSFAGLIETGAYDFGNPTLDKYVRRVVVLGHGKFLMQMRRNNISAVADTKVIDMTSSSDLWNDENWNAGTWGPDSIIKQVKVDTDIYGRQISFIFTDAETTIGKNLVELGSREYQVNAGEWGIYSAVFDGSVVGLRS